MKMHTGGNYGKEAIHEEQSKEKMQPNCGGDFKCRAQSGYGTSANKSINEETRKINVKQENVNMQPNNNYMAKRKKE